MLKFITYISGNTTWHNFCHDLPATYRPLPDWLRELMGLHSINMCAALYRIMDSQPVYSCQLAAPDTMQEAAIPPVAPGTLTLVGQGAAKIAPSEARFVGDKMWASDPKLYYESPILARLVVGGYSELVQASAAESQLTVKWPTWLHNFGNVVLTEAWQPGASVAVPVRWSYPMQEVDIKLRKSSAAYDFMEKYGVCAFFYAADTPEERICVMLSAMLQAVGYNKQAIH